jgi:hypothetical protein
MLIKPTQYEFDKAAGVFKDTNSNGDTIIFPYTMDYITTEVDAKTEFHITALKNKLIRDVARPNLFKVKIVPPRTMMSDWDSSKGFLTGLAKKSSIPQMKIGEYVFEHAGQRLHIPTNDVDYGEMSITFTNDSDYELRSMFNRWQRLAIFNWEKSIGSIPLLALDGNVTVFQYDSRLNPVYAVKLTNCWPQTISAIELSQDAENTAEEFTVDFKFTMQEIFKNYNI